MAGIARQDGKAVARAVVGKLVADVVKFFNVGKTMSAQQIATTTDLILEEFPHLKPVDIHLCFSMAKKGKFGPVYDRVDGQVIIGWLSEYDWMRQDEATRLNDNQAKMFKREEHDKSSYGPEYVKFLKEVVAKHKNPAGDTVALFESNGAYKTHQENQIDVMQRWMRQFDNLYGKYGIGGAIRMIEIGGKMMDMNKFLETKLKNREND